MTKNELIALLEEIVDASIKAGKPVLPEGRRDEVVSALNIVVADYCAYGDYLSALKAKLKSTGEGISPIQVGQDAVEIPFEQIAAYGFSVQPDELLAYCAISAEAINAIENYLWDINLEIGNWLDDPELNYETDEEEPDDLFEI